MKKLVLLAAGVILAASLVGCFDRAADDSTTVQPGTGRVGKKVEAILPKAGPDAKPESAH